MRSLVALLLGMTPGPQSEISFAQNPLVMREVARGHVRERTNRELLAARDPAARPRLVRHVAEQLDRCSADRPELVDVRAPGARVGARPGDRNVLVEAWQ